MQEIWHLLSGCCQGNIMGPEKLPFGGKQKDESKVVGCILLDITPGTPHFTVTNSSYLYNYSNDCMDRPYFHAGVLSLAV